MKFRALKKILKDLEEAIGGEHSEIHTLTVPDPVQPSPDVAEWLKTDVKGHSSTEIRNCRRWAS